MFVQYGPFGLQSAVEGTLAPPLVLLVESVPSEPLLLVDELWLIGGAQLGKSEHILGFVGQHPFTQQFGPHISNAHPPPPLEVDVEDVEV